MQNTTNCLLTHIGLFNPLEQRYILLPLQSCGQSHCFILIVSYITANLYCICLGACFMSASAYAVQICGNIRSTLYIYLLSLVRTPCPPPQKKRGRDQSHNLFADFKQPRKPRRCARYHSLLEQSIFRQQDTACCKELPGSELPLQAKCVSTPLETSRLSS